MDEIEITPLERPIARRLRVPGSKSISNRALILAAAADGRSTIEHLQPGDDTECLVAALRQLGFHIDVDTHAHSAVVEGTGGRIPARFADLYVGNAGTAMRFLAGFLTLGDGRFRVDGNKRMRERPIGELLEALRRLGAAVRSEGENECPPVIVEAGGVPFAGGATEIDARASSQFASALLMPAPLWPRGLRLRVIGDSARPFIDMTLGMMARWGAASTVEGDTIVVPGGQRYSSRNFTVEPDASAAGYFAAAAALCGGIVRLEGLGADSIQGDLAFLKILEKMGARVRANIDSVEVEGDGTLAGVDVAMNAMPDMVPTLAAIAPFATSPTRITGVGFIRFHESDRLRALATELGRLGARVVENDDGLLIEPSKLRPAAIETYDDHRIAMAFAVTGLRQSGVRIKNPGCVSKTYPGFFADLAALREPSNR